MFAAPLWLLLLGLGPVLIALHARRNRKVRVSSVLLWQSLGGEDSRRASWRLPPPNLLMVLELLFLLLLTLALAQPRLGSGNGPDHTVVVLDASASMEASAPEGSPWSLAKERARRIVESTDGEGRVSLVLGSSRPRALAARSDDAQEVARALDPISVTHAPTDWEAVAGLLGGLVDPGESTRLILLTDDAGQEEALEAVDDLLPGSVESVAFGGPGSNRGFAGARAVRAEEPGTGWLLEASVLADEGGWNGPVSVSFLPLDGGEPRNLGSVEVPVGDSGRGTLAARLDPEEAGVLELALPGDGLAHDDRARLVLSGAGGALNVLHVGPENPQLWRALRAAAELELYRARDLPEDSSSYDLVIVDGVPVDRHPGTNTLWLGVGPPEAAEEVLLRDPSPSGWDREHPLSQAVDWSVVTVETALQLQIRPGAAVLLDALGAPLLQAGVGPFGGEVVAAFSLADSNWVDQAGFPVFVANMLRWIDPQAADAGGASCQAGRPCPLPLSALREGASLAYIGAGEEVASLPEDGVADRSVVHWPRVGPVPSFVPERTGLYLLDLESGTRAIAVNAFYPSESSLPASTPATTGDPPEAPARGLDPEKWLLALAAVVLVVIIVLFRARRALPGGEGGRRRAPIAALLLALGFVALAVLDVPGPVLERSRSTVVIVDDPRVLGEAQRERLDQVLRALRAGSGQGDYLSVVRLSEPLAVEVGEDAAGLATEATGTSPSGNLEEALALARALLAGRPHGRVLVAAAGLETQGSVLGAAGLRGDEGIPVDVVDLGGSIGDEVLVREVTLPERLYPGVPFRLEALVHSQEGATASVRILRDGREWWMQEDVRLLPGNNRIEATLVEDEPGTYLYEVEVAAVGDAFRQNDHNGVVAALRENPRVAVVSPQPGWGMLLADALAVQGIEADLLAPVDAPASLTGWLAYDAVMLMNVPAVDLSVDQQMELERWVGEYGGGLVIMGGENAFGPGGYYQTTLETLSPLSARVAREQAEVSLLFVLDRSGSMQQAVGEATRIEIARQATLEAVRLLDERSRAGIVVFDSRADLLVPLQPMTSLEPFETALASLAPGGGTSLYPALVRAFDEMRNVDSATRHILVMTDGQSQAGDFDGIIEQIESEGITLSTVAIGQGASGARQRLEMLARMGNGTFHSTNDFRALPGIMAQEVLLLSSSPVREETVEPVWGDREPSFTRGLRSSLPQLEGYVRTTAKPEGRVHLATPNGDPLLASWRYGVGRVVSYASHGAGAWSLGWLAMSDYPVLWAQAARWVGASRLTPGLDLTVERSGDEVLIAVESLREDGVPELGLTLTATVSGGDGKARQVRLLEAQPGVYEATVALLEPGRYDVEVSSPGGDRQAAFASIHVPFPARYDFSRVDGELLGELARRTGGRVLEPGGELLAPPPALRPVLGTFWPAWAVLALGAFVLGLLLRHRPGYLQGSRLLGGSAPRSPAP